MDSFSILIVAACLIALYVMTLPLQIAVIYLITWLLQEPEEIMRKQIEKLLQQQDRSTG